MIKYTEVILKNGLKVVNFSSPQTMRFTDGSVLEGCPKKRYLLLRPSVTIQEMRWEFKEVCDLKIVLNITSSIIKELRKIDYNKSVDIIIVDSELGRAIQEYSRRIGGIPFYLRKCKLAYSDSSRKEFYHNKFVNLFKGKVLWEKIA